MFDSLKLADLPRIHCGILRGPSSTRPTLWVIRQGGVRAVVKDFSGNGFLFRHTVGRFLIWRESKAYRRIGNVKGVPTFFGVVEGLALVVQEIPGKSLEKFERGAKLPADFFEALENLIRLIHQRGLAHCDLKRAPNLILGDDGLPYIVDWAASISESEFGFFPLNRIYRRFLADDRMAILKLKLRHNSEMVSPEEKNLYRHRGCAEKTVRTLRDRLRKLLQKVA
jgi:RIO-like serine/threonine protein kinase